MTDKKVLKIHPLLDPKRVEKISGWKPWQPTISDFNVSEVSYQKYLEMEKKLIADQESTPLGSDPWAAIYETRKHLADAAIKFANEVDFKEWVHRTVNEAEDNLLAE